MYVLPSKIRIYSSQNEHPEEDIRLNLSASSSLLSIFRMDALLHKIVSWGTEWKYKMPKAEVRIQRQSAEKSGE